MLYSTCSGKGSDYKDTATGANVVKIVCTNGDVLEYWHNKLNTVPLQVIQRGDLVGVMGQTGITEGGEHLHYKLLRANSSTDPTSTL
jgi:murein DD-endopeptidase MepM/ murein hydrolase activator NlpD